MVKWVKRSTLRWFGYIKRMKNEEFKVYLSSAEGPSRRGRPSGRWEDQMKEYMSERGVRGSGLEQAGGSVWIGRGGGPSAVATTIHCGMLPEGVRRQRY